MHVVRYRLKENEREEGATAMREGSAPNFCPPVEEGIAIVLEDEDGERVELEFLGLILHQERR